MSSNEEYLDNLLKSLTEGGNDAGDEPFSSMTQETSVEDNTEVDFDKEMDDIEAMFASIGVETTEEEPLSGSATEAELVLNEPLMDEGTLSDELALEEEALPDELALEEEALSDEPALGEEALPDEPALEEDILPDELVLDDAFLSDETPMDEELLSDDLMPDGNLLSDDSASDGELAIEDTLPDELALDDGLFSEEMPIDGDLLSDDLTPDDGLALEESLLPDELALGEESMSDDLDLLLGELSLDESGSGNIAMEEPMSDDFGLEDNLLSEEPEDSMLDDFALEESGSDDLNLDELGLGDLGLEEIGEDEQDMMALDDVDGESSALDDFALEESGEDDEDLSALLASMGGDEDLSEINDLLEKSDQGVAVDDDMFAMLDGGSEGEEGDGGSLDLFGGDKAADGESENIREITPEELEERQNSKSNKEKKKEEKERKKQEKLAKKANKKKGSQGEEAEESGGLNDLLGRANGADGKAKEKGAFGRFLDFLLEEDDEAGEGAGDDSGDDGVVIGTLSDENKELLAELNAEDKKNAKKKDKKDKKDKKAKKGKKKDAEGGDGEEEAVAKPKKPKKEKKKKEKAIDEEPKVPEKKLSKKKVTSVFLFCATIAACVVIVTILLPEQMDRQEARLAYDQSQYTQVYELLYGKELNEEDEVLLHKSSIILQAQRKLNSSENYEKMDMQPEALNALLEGVSRCRDLRDEAAQYNVSGELDEIYGQILDALANNYALSESDALDIISSGDDVTYSQRVQAVISGESYGTEEAVPEGKQDVLPEEEEIIDRLQETEME